MSNRQINIIIVKERVFIGSTYVDILIPSWKLYQRLFFHNAPISFKKIFSSSSFPLSLSLGFKRSHFFFCVSLILSEVIGLLERRKLCSCLIASAMSMHPITLLEAQAWSIVIVLKHSVFIR